MFDKRLLKMAPHTKRYLFAQVGLMWVALAANIVFMLALAGALTSLLAGTAAGVPSWLAFLGVSAATTAGTGSLAPFLGIAAACVVVRLLCLAGAQRLGVASASAAKQAVRRNVYAHLTTLGPAYTEGASTAEAVQVCVEGVEQLESYFAQYLPQLVYAVLAPLTLFACVAPLSLPAAVALLACVPLIPLSIVAVMRVAKRIMSRYWDSYTDLGATFLENLQGLTTLKVFGADASRHETMNREAESFRKATMRLLRMQLSSVTIMDLFAYGGAAVGIVVALVQLAGGHASLFGALAVILLSVEFFLPMRTLGSYFHTAMNGMAAADRMFKILEVPMPAAGYEAVKEGPVTLETRGLTHSYDGTRRVLDQVNFVARPGSLTAVVGMSGSGKSTLAKALGPGLAGAEGQVLVSGVERGMLDPASLARAITVVPFEACLFSGTVRENLLLANADATDEQLWQALAASRADAFVRAAGGLDAELAEGGSNLSGGQRQRLALARAILHDSPAYIFDEATSNVDAESEQAILEAIYELAQTRTVVMISHRLRAVESAGTIYAMKDGRVEEQGSHQELLAADGYYSRLWEQQAELERYACAPGVANGAAGASKAEAALACEVEAALARESASVPEVACTINGAYPVAERPAGTANTPAIGTPKHRSHLSVMLRLVRLVSPLWPWMLAAIALGVAGFLCAIFMPTLAAAALASLATTDATLLGGLSFATLLVLLCACGILRGPLHYGEQICNHYLAFRILALVRDRLFGKLRELAPARLEGRRNGDLVSLVTSDVELLEVFYAHTLSPIVIAAIVSVIVSALAWQLSPALGLWVLAAFAFVGILMPLAASKAAGSSGRQLREGTGAMNAFVLESLRGLGTILQYGAQDNRRRELDERGERQAEAEARLKGRGAWSMSCVSAAVLVLDAGTAALAATLCAAGALSPMGAVVGTVLVASSFGPVSAVAFLGTTLQQTLASGARVLDVLDERPATPEVTAGSRLTGFDGAQANDVRFSYQAGPDVLRGVSLRVNPGEVVHLGGDSGCGKSTLCKLFMRFWDADAGRVNVSGMDVRGITTASLRAAQGHMTQETYLFNGTLRENILLARPDASESDVMRACEAAALGSFIEGLPAGLDTPVGELGSTLSGGERQRIGLARVFLQDASFILLDEPTSNLDTLSEAAILRSLDRHRAGKAVVLVSHRPGAASVADRSVTLRQGRAA